MAGAGPRERLRRQRGQSTVEFALVLPVIALVTFAAVDVAVVVRDAVRVQHAARDAARSLSIVGDPAEAKQVAVGELDGRAGVRIQSAEPGGTVRVEIDWPIAGHLGVLGRLRPAIAVSAAVSMRREGDSD